MAPTFEQVLQSGQFTFLVGEEKTPIVVHHAAIAATSDPMDCLMNGAMVEAETKCADLSEVRVEDFIRFCEYAYRGDYKTPQHYTVIPPADDQPTAEPSRQDRIEEEDDWGSSRLKKKKKASRYRSSWASPEESLPMPVEVQVDVAVEEPQPSSYASNKTILRTKLSERNYLASGDPKAKILASFIPHSNTSPIQNFTPVFLAHARLYSFANMKLIEPLKSLSLHKLHRTLLDFKLYANRVNDVLELVRYAYSNDHTPDRNPDGTIDELTKLVVEYVACELDTIGKSKEFPELMEEGGEFVGDFWRIVGSYLT